LSGLFGSDLGPDFGSGLLAEGTRKLNPKEELYAFDGKPVFGKVPASLQKLGITESRDVIKLIARGCLNKEIADRLDVTEGTVKSHTSALFSKLGVSNRTEAVREAVRRGLVRLE